MNGGLQPAVHRRSRPLDESCRLPFPGRWLDVARISPGITLDHYEELGIRRDATTQEIRDAFKLMARLLHPDKHLDPRLKDLAGCQMRRLADVVAILVDPRARARYNASLTAPPRPAPRPPLTRPVRPELLQVAVRHWLWILSAAMTIAMGAWYATADRTSPTVAAKSEREAPSDMQPAAIAGIVRGPSSRFVGDWQFSAADRGQPAPDPDSAELIELRLRQKEGILTGEYRALHHMFDPSISSGVAFRVHGELPPQNSARLDWESPSGAKGALTLTLTSPAHMTLKWWTTHRGTPQMPVSGAAALVRRSTP